MEVSLSWNNHIATYRMIENMIYISEEIKKYATIEQHVQKENILPILIFTCPL